MQLTIEMNCDNDAFQAIDADFIGEITSVINEGLMHLVDKEPMTIGLYDSYGNQVGELELMQ